MVARLLGLRLALLGAAFRGRPLEVVRRIALGLLAVAIAVAVAWLPEIVTTAGIGNAISVKDLGAIDTLLSAAVAAIALLVPIFSNRRHLEPRQFGQVPETPSTVASALLVSTVLSWPTLLLILWLIALAVLRPEHRGTWWALGFASLLVLLLAVCGARVTSARSKRLVPRRAGGTLRAVGVLVLVAALPVGVFVVAEALRTPGSTMTADAAQVLGWTPFGAPFAGAELAAEGDLSGAMLRFGIAIVAIIV
ncbi:MAG: hypothetical protein J0H64_03370, partial [Actinobacteria bacterium]|nr:hypothetical protein [Actinomycetota bacterium]